MRRWVIIILLIIYPFQVALALVDECCMTSAVSLTHHGVMEERADALAGTSAFAADDAVSAPTGSHCPTCNFGHQLYLPSFSVAIPVGHQRTSGVESDIPSPASPPPARLERPKWPAAAR